MQSYHSNRRETERTKRRAQRSSSSGGSVHNIRDPASQRCSSNARVSVFLAADGELSRPTGRRRHSSTTRRVQRPTSGRRKTRATPTPTSRGRRSSNALHLAATSIRRQQPAIADEQLSYSSDVPEPRSASDGGDETTPTATCSAVVR